MMYKRLLGRLLICLEVCDARTAGLELHKMDSIVKLAENVSAMRKNEKGFYLDISFIDNTRGNR